MSLSGRYWIPGPVEVDSDVALAMLRPMIPHRSAVARALVGRLQPTLQLLFGTTRPVMLATSSATAMMEAAVRSGVRERLLAVVSGTFGERFAEVAERCGRDVVRLHVPHGGVLLPELLDQLLDGPVIDAVSFVHCETSTGALAPVAELVARFRSQRDVVTLVDVVSSLGGVPVDVDRWGADFVFGATQKALGLPPGLTLSVASAAFIARAAELDDRGFYLDVVDLLRAAEESRFPQTPALPIVNALDVQLERIVAEGLSNRFARHRAMGERVESWVAAHGRCGILAPEGYRSDTVTALTLTPGKSATQVVLELQNQGWMIATGIDADADSVLRIGHMGDLSVAQLNPLLKAIEPLL